MNIISFNVKFQSDSTKDGEVIAGGIYTTFLPVKYSRVVRVSFRGGQGGAFAPP